VPNPPDDNLASTLAGIRSPVQPSPSAGVNSYDDRPVRDLSKDALAFAVKLARPACTVTGGVRGPLPIILASSGISGRLLPDLWRGLT
jgi:hypothetical protein